MFVSKPFLKNRILREFLTDSLLIDKSVYIKDYNFNETCLMAPFYAIIQAIKEINLLDLYSAQILIEEAQSYNESFLMTKVAEALLSLEKNEYEEADKIIQELKIVFFERPTLHRFYLRATDEVYTADYLLFKKWFPLLCFRASLYNEPSGKVSVGINLNDCQKMALLNGLDPFWFDLYRKDTLLSSCRKRRDFISQEKIIDSLIESYNENLKDAANQENLLFSETYDISMFAIQQIFLLAEQYEIIGKHSRALFWCDNVLLLNPGNKKALSVKIEIFKKQKLYRCALGFCNSFISSNPDDSIGYYLRCGVYYMLKENKKAYRDAQDCYSRAKDKKLGLMARGFALLNLDEYEKAVGCFEMVCSMGYPSYETFRGLGKAYASMDRTLEALACYMKCKRIDPQDLDLLYDIADTQFMGGYFVEARKSCITCIKQNPYFVSAYVLLGMIALREENSSLAMKYFDKTLTIDPQNAYALNEKGYLHFLEGNEEFGSKLIEQALNEFPEYADAICNKGIMLAYSLDFDDALSMFEKAIALIPEHIGSNLGKASMLMQDNNINDALSVYEYVLKLNPSNEEAKNGKEMISKIMGVFRDTSDEEFSID